MATKENLKTWVLEALQNLGGSGSVVEVSRHVWQKHEPELRTSGDLFFTWQYDLRWAAHVLRNEGVLTPVGGQRGEPWRLMQ